MFYVYGHLRHNSMDAIIISIVVCHLHIIRNLKCLLSGQVHGALPSSPKVTSSLSRTQKWRLHMQVTSDSSSALPPFLFHVTIYLSPCTVPYDRNPTHVTSPM